MVVKNVYKIMAKLVSKTGIQTTIICMLAVLMMPAMGASSVDRDCGGEPIRDFLVCKRQFHTQYECPQAAYIDIYPSIPVCRDEITNEKISEATLKQSSPSTAPAQDQSGTQPSDNNDLNTNLDDMHMDLTFWIVVVPVFTIVVGTIVVVTVRRKNKPDDQQYTQPISASSHKISTKILSPNHMVEPTTNRTTSSQPVSPTRNTESTQNVTTPTIEIQPPVHVDMPKLEPTIIHNSRSTKISDTKPKPKPKLKLKPKLKPKPKPKDDKPNSTALKHTNESIIAVDTNFLIIYDEYYKCLDSDSKTLTKKMLLDYEKYFYHIKNNMDDKILYLSDVVSKEFFKQARHISDQENFRKIREHGDLVKYGENQNNCNYNLIPGTDKSSVWQTEYDTTLKSVIKMYNDIWIDPDPKTKKRVELWKSRKTTESNQTPHLSSIDGREKNDKELLVELIRLQNANPGRKIELYTEDGDFTLFQQEIKMRFDIKIIDTRKFKPNKRFVESSA